MSITIWKFFFFGFSVDFLPLILGRQRYTISTKEMYKYILIALTIKRTEQSGLEVNGIEKFGFFGDV